MDRQFEWQIGFPAGFILSILLLAITLVTYRLFFSPLAKIPGPKIAAATGWYEFYHDCILAGKYIFEIERMHDIYGPIVRISPHEIHIRDSDFFLQLNSNTSKLDKDAWYYNFVAAPLTGFGTASHELHRTRRLGTAKYFSTANIQRLEPLIQSCMSKLMWRLNRLEGKVVNLSDAYRCFTTDVISEYALPRSNLMLESPDFGAGINRLLRYFTHIAIWNRHVPIIFPLLRTVPRWVIATLDPGPSLAVFDYQQFLKDSATSTVASYSQDRHKERRTILHEIYEADLRASEHSISRLAQEAQTLFGAGVETTGNTLSVTTFYLVANPPIAERLRKELLGIGDDLSLLLSHNDLQRLPYLSAVISEGLRISTSATGRLPRVNSNAAMAYQSYIIPAGTAVSTSIPDVHFDEAIFPDAHIFKPERWLEDGGKALEKYLVPFGKGPRSCVGMTLALAELYMVIGNIFRALDMKLVDTTEEDMTMAHDFFSPFGPADSKGLQAAILEPRDM